MCLAVINVFDMNKSNNSIMQWLFPPLEVIVFSTGWMCVSANIRSN